MRRIVFWLRWSARDLRARWLQVAAIALIVAIGTGMSAALGSLSVWRKDSYDASYALLHVHDVRVSLPQGSSVPAGALEDAMRDLEERGVVATAEERLIVPTQVDASSTGRTILVPGVLIGLDLRGGGPHLDRIDVTRGRALRAADAAPPGVAVLEAHFADHYALPSSGTVALAGGVPIRYVGAGYTPEYFMVTTPAGGFLAESNFAAVFVPIEVARSVAGARVSNDLVVDLASGVDRRRAANAVAAAVRAAAPGIAITVTPIADDPAYRGLYGDLEGDERTMNSIAMLIFVAAVFAAFNLTSRIVEARRREIGIGMALGQRTAAIAARPLLMGLEIGLLGAVFGIGVGLLIDAGMNAVMASLQPLPVWETPFQPEAFARAAALGAVLPLLAALWPVWRAVRVRPVEAIRTGHLAAKGGRLAPLLQRLTAGRRSVRLMPVRNVLRSPRRAILTAIGIGASITAMVGVIGLLDSFGATVDRGADEVGRGAAGRLEVSLATFEPVRGQTLHAIAAAEGVQAVQPSLRLAGRLGEGPQAFDVVLEALDLNGEVWHPTIEGRVDPAGVPGIVLARKAAEDLDLVPGDVVRVTYPVVSPGDETFRRATTSMRVIGLHPYPMRSFAYLDASEAGVFGLSGMMNAVHVGPAPGSDIDASIRSIFGLPGVASVQSADATVEVLRDLISAFVDILRFVEIFVLILALLIAFNAASITVDERAREHATMSAFGVRTRRIVAGITEEGLVIGLTGTAIGVVLGRLAVGWLTSGTGEEIPDLELILTVSISTIATAFAMGVVAVGVAPLLTVRRLLRMDVPSTLRVME